MSTEIEDREFLDILNSVQSEEDREWLRHYMNDPKMNGTEAAKHIGYTGKYAGEKAAVIKKRLLPQINRWLALRAELTKFSSGLDPLRVLRELARIAYVNPGDWLRVDEAGNVTFDEKDIPVSDWAAIDTFKVTSTERGTGADKVVRKTLEFKISGKQTALVNLGKHMQLFPQAASSAPEQTRAGSDQDAQKVIEEIFDLFESPPDEV